jgi:hypothetical protein
MRTGGYKLRAKVLAPASTETEGEMDFATFRIKLSDPKHPHFFG